MTASLASSAFGACLHRDWSDGKARFGPGVALFDTRHVPHRPLSTFRTSDGSIDLKGGR